MSKSKKIVEVSNNLEELQNEVRLLRAKLTLAEADTYAAQMQASVGNRDTTGLSKDDELKIKYFDFILEKTENIIFFLDVDKKFTYASRSFLNKVKKENYDLINGKYYRDVLKPYITKTNFNRLSGAVNNAKTTNVVIPFDEETDEEGVKSMYLTHVFPMIENLGAFKGTMVLIKDVTAIKNAKEVAEQEQFLKSKFLSNMNHEIRTPLNAIIGLSTIELDKKSHRPKTLEAFEKINLSGRNLMDVLNDIIDLSTMEAGKLEINNNVYDTAALINDVIWLNVMRIGDKPINFEVKLSEKIPAYLVGDEQRIKQAINNLLSNAIKYTDHGSVIFEVGCKNTKGDCKLIVTIRDTGQGISKSQLELIFDKASLAAHDFNRETEGAGFGLFIAKNLATLMKGDISAESALGAGSAFTMSFIQKISKNTSNIGIKTAERLQNFKFSGMQKPKLVRDYMPYGKILIVDDMNTNLFVAKGLMKPYGLDIDTALSGYEALEKVSEGKVYDIIFMDHMMPGMDGMETTKKMREEGYKHPIIALTANVTAGVSSFTDNGFDDFIAKPIDTMQLNVCLNAFVRDKQTAETLEAANKQKEADDAAAEEAAKIPVSPTDFEDANDPLTLLKKIQDLDVDTAVDAMSGLPDLYIDTVKLTLKLLPERITKLDDYLESDLKSFTIEVHGLKSAMKNIGAAKLGNSASQLERAGIEENLQYCKEHYPPFKDELLRLKEKLDEALPSDTEVKEIANKSDLLPAIAEAKAKAEDYNRDAALEIIQEKAKFSYDEKTDEQLQKVISALEAFDCEGAKNILIELEEI
ncbi:MAG: response regulator [Defluviitaleaceae bacterium]|nr:response regulator [Defluviitaleaceae bacterium]